MVENCCQKTRPVWQCPEEKDLCKNLVKLVDGKVRTHSAPFPGTTKSLPRFMSDMDFWLHEADPHRSLSSGTDLFRIYLCTKKLNCGQTTEKKERRERDIPVYRPERPRHRACNYEPINNVLAHFSIPQPAPGD